MQVWCNGRVVGNARIQPLPGQREHVVHVMGGFDWSMSATTDPLEEISPAAARRVYLQISKRSVAVDDIEFMQGLGDVEALVRRHHNIPDDAEVSHNLNLCKRIFSWKVFDINPDVFEEIFDMDWFVPTDTGEVDNEALERAWRATV